MLRISGGTGKGNLNTGGVIVAVSPTYITRGIGSQGWASVGVALFTVTTVVNLEKLLNMLVATVVARIRNLPELSNVIVVPLIVATSVFSVLFSDSCTIAY